MNTADPLESVGGVDVESFTLSAIQEAFWNCTDTFQDIEGATRSGKTTIVLLKVIHRCESFPGLNALVCRWKDKDTDEILVPHFRRLIAGDSRWSWNSKESCFELHQNDVAGVSRVYPRGLKPSENAAPFSNFAGLTLGLIAVDQLEECDRDVIRALKARLSQKLLGPDGTYAPLEMYVSPNPPDEEHWINDEFPVGNSMARNLLCKPKHRYFRATLYDNAANLHPETVALLETEYPAGDPLRRRFIEGRRGLTAKGTPVYKRYFNSARHVRSERNANGKLASRSQLFDAALPLYESWDFGHSSPCVTWHQAQNNGARWVILGGVQGKDIFLEDFAPVVLRIRQRIFHAGVKPVRDYIDSDRYRDKRHAVVAWLKDLEAGVLSVGDPAGATNNSQGTNRSAVTVLRDLGIHVETQPNANAPDRRDYAIQVLSGYMRRSMPSGEPCFVCSDRFYRVSLEDGVQERSFLTDAFEAGYVWGELAIGNTSRPNTRRPKKDGVYDHSQNTCEYAVLKFAPPNAAAAAGVFHTPLEQRRHERQVEREQERARRDHDPADAADPDDRGRRGGYFSSYRQSRSGYGGLSRGGI